MKHITDILLGKLSNFLQIWDYHKLSTFGLCANYTEATIRRTIRQMYVCNIIDIDPTDQKLKLMEKAKPILKGLEDIYLPENISQDSREMYNTMWLRTPYEEQLYRQLILWRQSKAIINKIPYLLIISDRTIFELVKNRPQNLSELPTIFGIGKTKLKKYGEEIINIITAYNQQDMS